MNERPVAAVLALLPFAYVAAVVLPSFPAQDLGVGFAFVMSVVIGILSAMPSPRAQEIGAWVGIGLAIIIGVTFSEIQMFGDLGAQLAAGVLLGMPWIAVAYVWRPGEQVRNRFIALGLGLLLGTLLLAAAQTLSASTSAFTAPGYVQAFYFLNLTQVEGILGLLTGAGGLPLPLHTFFDPIFVALGGVSVLGLLLVMLRPQTGRDQFLPITLNPRWRAGTIADLPGSYGFAEVQQAVFRDRTVSEPPGSAWPPGLISVVIAAVTTSVFVALAFLTPFWALLSVTVAAAVAGGALVASAGPVRRRAVRPTRPAAREPVSVPTRVDAPPSAPPSP
jgi:hypothetical protein